MLTICRRHQARLQGIEDLTGWLIHIDNNLTDQVRLQARCSESQELLNNDFNISKQKNTCTLRGCTLNKHLTPPAAVHHFTSRHRRLWLLRGFLWTEPEVNCLSVRHTPTVCYQISLIKLFSAAGHKPVVYSQISSRYDIDCVLYILGLWVEVSFKPIKVTVHVGSFPLALSVKPSRDYLHFHQQFQSQTSRDGVRSDICCISLLCVKNPTFTDCGASKWKLLNNQITEEVCCEEFVGNSTCLPPN